MTIYKQNDKILTDISGQIIDDSASESSLILQIDGNDQYPNRILKDSSNNVRQITDKAQNIAFVQTDINKQPKYNFGDGKSYYVFDGVDDYIKTEPISFNFGQTCYIELYFYLGAGTGTNEYILKHGGSTNFQLYVNTSNSLVGGGAMFGFGAIARNTWHHCIWIWDYENNKTLGFLNGICKQSSPYLTPPNTNTYELFIGANSLGQSNLLGNVSYLRFGKGNPFDVDYSYGGDYSARIQPKPFTYHKRYNADQADLYLSSKYLKDAVISTTNEITSIKESVNGYVVNGFNIQVSNSGFVLSGSNSYLLLSNVQWLDGLGSGDFHFAVCLCTQTVTGFKYYMSLPPKIYIYANGATLLGQVGGVNITFTTALQTNKWVRADLIRVNGVVYAYLDGILRATSNNTTDLSNQYTNYYLGNTGSISPLGLMDGAYINIWNSPIIPSGVIGRQDFQPPQRGGFNSNFITF